MNKIKIWRDSVNHAEEAGSCTMLNQHFMEILFDEIVKHSKTNSKVNVEFVDSFKDQSPCWKSFTDSYYEVEEK